MHRNRVGVPKLASAERRSGGNEALISPDASSFIKSTAVDSRPKSAAKRYANKEVPGTSRTKVVTIEDYDFSLHSITVFVGDTIEFTVSPNVPGHVEHVLEGRCASRPELNFESSVLQRPDSVSFRYQPKAEGEIMVRCQVYTDMLCRVFVVSWSTFHRLSTFVASSSHRIAPCTRLNGDVKPYKETGIVRAESDANWGGEDAVGYQGMQAISLRREWSECSGSEAQQSVIDSDDQLSVVTTSSRTYLVPVPGYDRDLPGAVAKVGEDMPSSRTDEKESDNKLEIPFVVKQSSLYASPTRPSEVGVEVSSSPTVRSVVAKDLEFNPPQLTIVQGITVEFVCEATSSSLSISCDDEFDMVTIGSGGLSRFRHTFNHPGNFCVRNEIFRFMRCDIYVTPKVKKLTPKPLSLALSEDGENLQLKSGDAKPNASRQVSRTPFGAVEVHKEKKVFGNHSSSVPSNGHDEKRSETILSHSIEKSVLDGSQLSIQRAYGGVVRNVRQDDEDSISSVSDLSDGGDDGDNEEALNDVKLRLQKYKQGSHRLGSLPRGSLGSGKKQSLITSRDGDDEFDEGDYGLYRSLPLPISSNMKASGSPPLRGSFWRNPLPEEECVAVNEEQDKESVVKKAAPASPVAKPLFGSFLAPQRVASQEVSSSPQKTTEGIYAVVAPTPVENSNPPMDAKPSAASKRRLRRKQTSKLNESAVDYASSISLPACESIEPLKYLDSEPMQSTSIDVPVVIDAVAAFTGNDVDISSNPTTNPDEVSSTLIPDAEIHEELVVPSIVEETIAVPLVFPYESQIKAIVAPIDEAIPAAKEERRKRERKRKPKVIVDHPIVLLPSTCEVSKQNADIEVKFNFFAEELHADRTIPEVPSCSDQNTASQSSASKDSFDVISALRSASEKKRVAADRIEVPLVSLGYATSVPLRDSSSGFEDIESFFMHRWNELSSRRKACGFDIFPRGLEAPIVEYQLLPSFAAPSAGDDGIATSTANGRKRERVRGARKRKAPKSNSEVIVE